MDNPLYQALMHAGASSGQGCSDDLNGYQPEGVGRLDRTTREGYRCSAADAHLVPALRSRKERLSLHTRVQVERIAIENGRAVGK